MIHGLIETDTLTDRGDRKDFAGAPPDLSHKTPPLKWVPVTARPDPAVPDPDTHKLEAADDVVTADGITVSKKLVEREAEDKEAIARQRRGDNLEADFLAICDRMRPAGATPPGEGVAWNDLAKVERTKFARYVAIQLGGDA